LKKSFIVAIGGRGGKAQRGRHSRGSGGDCRNVLEAGWCLPQTADGELAFGAASKLWPGLP